MVASERDIQINIDNNVGRLRDSLGQFMAGIPEIEDEMAEKMGDDLVDNLRQSIRNKFSMFKGKLESNVKNNKRTQDPTGVSYRVSANAYSNDGVNYAAWHEYAQRSHFAYYESNGTKNRELIQWAKMNGLYEDTWRIKVTPVNQKQGSFVSPAIQKSISQLRQRLSSGNATQERMSKTFGS